MSDWIFDAVLAFSISRHREVVGSGNSPYLVDTANAIIVDAEASCAIRQAEVEASRSMIDRTEERLGLKAKRLAADSAYGSAANLAWLVEKKGIAPHIPVIDKSGRTDGTLSRADFGFIGNAARTRRRARSRATSTRMPVMWPGPYMARPHSSNPAVTANRSRCCSPISSAFSSSAGCGCADHAGHRTNFLLAATAQNQRSGLSERPEAKPGEPGN